MGEQRQPALSWRSLRRIQAIRKRTRRIVRRTARRYGRGAILITINKSVRDWTELLAGGEVLATPFLDRLPHKTHVLNIKGRSYRLRGLEQSLDMTGIGSEP